MKRFVEFAVKLYPAAWRKRYEPEFTALLEDVNPNWRTALDVLGGAVAMQLRTLSFGRVLGLAGLAGLIVGFGIWVASPSQYLSHAVIRIESPGTSRQMVVDHVTALARTVFRNESLGAMVQQYNLYPEERKKIPLEDVISQMKEHVLVTPHGQDTFLLRFDYPDPVLAQKVTADFVSGFMEAEGDHGPNALPVTLELTEAPSIGTRLSPPTWMRLTGTGLVVGLAIGLCAAFLRRAPKAA